MPARYVWRFNGAGAFDRLCAAAHKKTRHIKAYTEADKALAMRGGA